MCTLLTHIYTELVSNGDSTQLDLHLETESVTAVEQLEDEIDELQEQIEAKMDFLSKLIGEDCKQYSMEKFEEVSMKMSVPRRFLAIDALSFVSITSHKQREIENKLDEMD